MIIYFISALLISFVLFKLGSYVAIIWMITVGIRIGLVLASFVVLFLLLRRFSGPSRGV